MKRVGRQMVKDRDEQFRRYESQIEALKADMSQRASETERRHRAEADMHAQETANNRRKIAELEAQLASARSRASGEETELMRSERKLQQEGFRKLEADLRKRDTKIEEQTARIEVSYLSRCKTLKG